MVFVLWWKIWDMNPLTDPSAGKRAENMSRPL
jgi:hypothetical protein